MLLLSYRNSVKNSSDRTSKGEKINFFPSLRIFSVKKQHRREGKLIAYTRSV